jgi:3-hydroxyisobutyrate dehydrogenase
MGDAGSGQHIKMASQILIAHHDRRRGVPLYAGKPGWAWAVIDVIGRSRFFLVNQQPGRRIARDFNPGFFIKHFIKDMG